MSIILNPVWNVLGLEKMRFNIFIVFFIISNLPILTQAIQPDDSIVASVGNHSISIVDFTDRYSDYLFSSGTEDNFVIREAILNNMINEALLYYYDSNEKILSDADYLRELDWSWKQTVLGYLKDQEVYAKITVTDEELRETFLKVNEQIAARHLFATSLDEAMELYDLLQLGFDFNTLAQKVFTDTTLKNNGGYLGYFTWGDMDPAFEEVAYSLKIGEISKPIKTSYGYSIIKLEDRITHPLLTEYEFRNKKSSLERTLRIRKKRPYEKEYLNRVFDRKKVLFNEIGLEQILGKLQYAHYDDIEFNNNDLAKVDCVEYNGENYNVQIIEEKLSKVPYYHKQKINSIKKLKVVIEGLLIQDVLYELAVEKGFEKEPLVLETYKILKNNVFLKYKMNEIMYDAELSDSILFKYYTENIRYFSTSDEINLQEIIVDNAELADKLLERIEDGEDFGEIARQNSLREWSAVNNGEIGYTVLGEIGIMQEIFWEAEVGDVLGPYRTGFNIGIFKILGKIESHPIDFYLIKEDVIKAAKYEQKTQLVADYINEIRKNVEIKINHQLLNGYKIVGL
jgi:parvulin-like peptidyl-prolyl isomerase